MNGEGRPGGISETANQPAQAKASIAPPNTVLIRLVDGEPIVTAEAGELLFGIPAAEISAGMTAGMANGTETFPPEWLRSAERRAAEALTATGDSSILAALTYWAKRDHGVELTFGPIE